MKFSARRGVFCSLFFFIASYSHFAKAQSYGNEWIDADKVHIKIPIAKDGIYRLGYFSVEAYFTEAFQYMSNIPFSKFRMYCMGKEVPIYIHDPNGNNLFDPFEFVEFVGHPADGSFDTELYDSAFYQRHALRSMITDSNYYFFTWRSAGSGLRYKNYSNSSPPPTAPKASHRTEKVFFKDLTYHYGIPIFIGGSTIFLSEYSRGEGFCGDGIVGTSDTNKFYSVLFNTEDYDSAGGKAWIESVVIGSSISSSQPFTFNHRLVSKVGPGLTTHRRVGDTSWLAMGTVRQTFVLKPSDIGNQTYLHLNTPYINDLNSNINHSHTRISFPQKYNLFNAISYTYTEDTSSVPVNIQWSNYGSGSSSLPWIYDETNYNRISGVYNSGNVKYTLPAMAKSGRMIIADQSEIVDVLNTDCKSVKMYRHDSLFNVIKSYLMITSKALYEGPKEEVKIYANGWGTRYNVSTHLIEDLYNVYSYGIPHPLAIRHFCKYLLDNSSTNKPAYLLLIGRGFDTRFNRGDGLVELTPHISRNHLPAIGSPVSDIMYTSGLNGTLQEPAIPTGRIPADKEEDLGIYRTKLQSYLNNYNNYAEWQKDVLHLGGGAYPQQVIQIQDKLNALIPYVEKDPFAGTVHTYSKAAGSTVDVNFRSAIINNINSGVNLVTFLGHGSPVVTDIDVGNVNDYLNENKYPICYFNGCQVGNPCLPVDLSKIGLSEKMFRADRKGAIAFIGQASTSELNQVSLQMDRFYQAYFDSGQDKSIGKVLQSTIKNYQVPVSSLNRLHCQQLFLQGDPALPIYNPDYPDFSVTTESVFLDPPNAIALQDSFRVGVIIKNLGKGVKDSFDVDLVRTYPDQITVRRFNERWRMHGMLDTVYFIMRTKDKSTAGNNTFAVSVNGKRNPVEFTYDNNQITKIIYLPANGVNLIMPERFAIVGTDSVELVVQKSDLFKESEDFYIEIDTTPRFNSPLLQSLEKNSQPLTAGVLARWKVKLMSLKDTQPYFWRARINVPANQGGTWSMNSFTYIKDHREGWMQNAHWQYTSEVAFNGFNDLTVDTNARALKFARKAKSIYLDCEYNNTSNKGVKETGFGGQDLNFGVCVNGLVAIPWDGRKLIRKPVDTSKIQPNCFWGRAWRTFGNADNYMLYYAFDLGNPVDQDRLVTFIDAMEDSMYVTFYSRVLTATTLNSANWKPEVFQALNKVGSTLFDTVANRTYDAVYLGLGKKGWAPGMAQEIISQGSVQKYIQLEATMHGDAKVGSMLSENIGTTNRFNEMYFRADVENDGVVEADQLDIDVLGYKNDGSFDVLKSNEKVTKVDLQGINPVTYKFLKLRVEVEDTINHTSPNLNNWRVLYDSVPEGTLYPNVAQGYIFHRDTLYEGDTFYIKLPFKNISSTPFRDSLHLVYSLQQKITRKEIAAGDMRFTALKKDSSFYFVFKFPTKGLAGPYGLQVSVNPQFEQPEKTLVNNNSLINFFVKRDNINPILDVTFDGRHILNADIVSANPVIMITSKDENEHMWQQDTSTFDLFLKKPGGAFVQIPFGSEAQFFPATNKENKARIEFRPADLQNGLHTLKVQSRDANKNVAGNMEYEVDFNVIREQTVTNFYPYPNPFTSNMKFVFTLTGTEVPDEINVKIMTAEGRVVKELRKEDLGSLRIGNNITDWSWDGTDQFGDKLGNGTYFFKVTVKTAGEEVKLRATKGDGSFKDQVGVIYLMR